MNDWTALDWAFAVGPFVVMGFVAAIAVRQYRRAAR